jgi:flagellar biosynthesis chaperone FliJ
MDKNKTNYTLVEEVVDLTKKFDSTLSNLISEEMNKCENTEDQLMQLTAIINTLSYFLGRSMAELVWLSNKPELQNLALVSGKIVQDGISDFNKDLNKSLININ